MASDLGMTIYNDTAKAGRILTLISSIVVTVICLLVLVYGIYLMSHPEKETENTVASIKNASCTQETTTTKNKHNTTTTTSMYNCDLDLNFTDNNATPIDTNLNTKSSTLFRTNQQVPIQYDPNNSKQVRLKTSTNMTRGTWMLLISLLIILIAWGWYWLVVKYKFLAS